jgi:hypothetical protein
MKFPFGFNLKNFEKLGAIIFGAVATILILLGASASSSSLTLSDAQALNLPKYIGLSTSAWHQELDVYFTLKALSTKQDQGLGLREPIQIEKDLVGFIPLKFYNYLDEALVRDRPYLSSSGILADLGKVAINVLEILGLSKLTGLMLLYLVNILMNTFFVYLLLVFGKVHLTNRLRLNIYRIAVMSPWILLDSTSLMFSPAIRFGGVFALLFYWYLKSNNLKWVEVYVSSFLGLLFSSLNGFEFYFFQLSILMIYLQVILLPSKFSRILIFWVALSASAWIASLFLWATTVFSNLRNFTDSIQLILYTLFKHSLFRSESVPLGAVSSGDSSLGALEGLLKIATRMSILLPHPFPKSLQSKLGISDELLAALSIFTTVLVFLILIIIFSQRFDNGRGGLLGVLLWSLSAITINSYVFNHPHHMPPVGLFLVLSIYIFSFREKVTHAYRSS